MKIRTISTLLSAVVLTAVTNGVWAAGTAAGTTVANTASISYKVGTVDQTAIESSSSGNSNAGAGNGQSTDFVVDKKIDLSVTAATGVNVVPGSTSGNDMTFPVLNEGNSTETFSFSIDSTVGGDFDAESCTAAPTSASLTADQTQNVVVSCSIPVGGSANNAGAAGGSVADKKTSVVDLLATVTGVTETAGADTAGTMDTVFADGTGTSTDGDNRNAKHSAKGTYTVNTADISVAKTSAVVKMQVNGSDITAANGAKRIPGATVKYTIIVSNAAGAGATAAGIVISDVVPANLTYAGCTVSGSGIASCSESGGTVSSGAFDLTKGQTATLEFTAKVN